jgi:hypothetical protein
MKKLVVSLGMLPRHTDADGYHYLDVSQVRLVTPTRPTR